MIHIAVETGWTLEYCRSLLPQEYNDMVAYFQLRADERNASAKRQRQQSKGKVKRR